MTNQYVSRSASDFFAQNFSRAISGANRRNSYAFADGTQMFDDVGMWQDVGFVLLDGYEDSNNERGPPALQKSAIYDWSYTRDDLELVACDDASAVSSRFFCNYYDDAFMQRNRVVKSVEDAISYASEDNRTLLVDCSAQDAQCVDQWYEFRDFDHVEVVCQGQRACQGLHLAFVDVDFVEITCDDSGYSSGVRLVQYVPRK